MVYWNFEEKYHLKRESIPDHILEFADSLRGMFGAGSSSLVKRFAVQMNSTYHIDFIESDDLVSLVKKARKEFLNGTNKD